MAMPEIDEVKDAALKYDKKALAKMVQMGQMSNTTAMMAAMMRDRIVQSEMKPPAPPTVADEVFQPAQGLAAVPTDPRMFQGMAGGGIVAMADGGTPPSATFMGSLTGGRTIDPRVLRAQYLASGMSIRDLPDELKTPEERAVYAQRQPAQQDFSVLGQPENTATSGNIFKRIGDAIMYSSDREAAERRAALAAMPDQSEAETQRLAAAAARATPTFTGAAAAPAPAPKPQAKPQAKPLEKGLGATKEAQDFAALRSAQADVEKTLKDQMGDKPTIQGTIESGRAFDKEYGVDRDFFKKQAADLIAQRDELKGDRKEAANMRLLEAGLAILGGTSPYAFENIGKGASKALAGFADDIKDIKRQTRELEKARQDVLRAEQVAARSDSAKAQDRFEKRSDEYKKMQLKMAETRADFATKYEELGLRKEALKVQREQANRTPAEIQLIERYNSDPKFAAAFDKMQTARQAPKTEAALRKEYTENYALLKKDFPTVQDYINSQMGGSKVPGVEYMGVRPN